MRLFHLWWTEQGHKRPDCVFIINFSKSMSFFFFSKGDSNYRVLGIWTQHLWSWYLQSEVFLFPVPPPFPIKTACAAWARASMIVSALSMCVNTHLAVPDHSLISCDSDILASVFLTRRAVRREAGLWAQHSVISFPICLKHCGETDLCCEGH